MKKINPLFLFLTFVVFSNTIKAQNFQDSIKISKEITRYLEEYGKATVTVDSAWFKTNLADSFQYSDPLNYNLGKADYLSLYTKGVYKITKSDAVIDRITKKDDQFQVLVHSQIEGNAAGQAVSGVYPFIFKLDHIGKKFKVKSIEVSQ